MLKILIQYQISIIIGILVFPIFAFIIYFIKNLVDRAKFMRVLHNMKKPLMERINNIEVIYEIKEQKEEINVIMNEIKNDINMLKQEINGQQGVLEVEKINQIEEEITIFYEKIKNPEITDQRQTIWIAEEAIVKQETPQQVYENAIMQQQAYQSTINQQENALHKEQVKVMNANISKFLIVYKEKDKAIDERNSSIHILQQKLNEAEHKLKTYRAEHENNKNKDIIIEEKTKEIVTLKQRLQEIEDKFRKMILLYKSISEKEEMQENNIEQKNKFISNLEHKLYTIEKTIQNMKNINEENKENNLNKEIIDIDEKIQSEKRKNWTFVILLILFLLVII